MANDENLKPQSMRTKSEQREIARKGGKASGESRRRSRDLKAALFFLLNSKVKGQDNQTYSERIALAWLTKAANGDMKAIEKIWDALYGTKTQIDHTSTDGSMSPKEFTIHFIKPGENVGEQK